MSLGSAMGTGETLRALRAKGGRKGTRDFTSSSARVTQPCRLQGITWRLSRKRLGGNLCKSQGFSLHVYVGGEGSTRSSGGCGLEEGNGVSSCKGLMGVCKILAQQKQNHFSSKGS